MKTASAPPICSHPRMRFLSSLGPRRTRVPCPSVWTIGIRSPIPTSSDAWKSMPTPSGRRQLRPDASFALAPSWYSSRTRLGAEGTVVELGILGGLVRAPLSLSVPGAAAGGRLDLHTRLVLRHAGADPGPISPRREGATLWSEQTRVALEGGSSRFPVTAVDFTPIQRLPDEGSWALEWDTEELEGPVLGGLRLLVNSSEETLLSALRSGSADAAANVIRRFITFDVARALVHGALANDRFVADPESFDEGSIGRMLFDLLAMTWPGMPVKALVARHREDPSRLDAELQAHVGVLA